MNKTKTPVCNFLDDLKKAGAKTLTDIEKANAVQKNSASQSNHNTQQRHTTYHADESFSIVDPNEIKNWDYHDRPSAELGDIQALAEELKTIGQQQPCIIRPYNGSGNFKYEVIAGQRRWLAAKQAKIKLKVLIKNLSDHDAALCQAGENSQRKDLSDFAKGLNYYHLIEQNILTRSELQAKLQLSKSSIRNLLSYARIDQNIINSIGDMSKISPATAYEISRLQSKGPDYFKILVSLSPKLRTGKIGHTKLEENIKKKLNSNGLINEQKAQTITANDGRHIFTWRNDTNGNKSITFPKDIRNVIDFQTVTNVLLTEIQKQLEAKKTSSG